MFKICLIQNRNEMLHYDFADNRKLLDDMGFEYILYTSNNIKNLVPDVNSLDFDTIIISTNALSDNSIKSELYSNEFKNSLEKHLNKQKGLLIFSQLKISEEKDSFSFIPSKYGNIEPIKRNDDPISGSLNIESFYRNNSLFIFPNEININHIEQMSKNSKNIEGLYWHYFQTDQRSLWESLVVDKKSLKPLIIHSKTANIFCSSILLDWQKHKDLFYNMLISSIANDDYIGIIENSNETDISYRYLIKALELNKKYFKRYNLISDKDLLVKNIMNNVHSYIILSPNVSYDDLPKQMCDSCDSVDINIIDMKNKEYDNNFALYGSSNSMKKYIQDIEYFIQKELHENQKGYIDNSFWKTIETLQVLDMLRTDYSKRYNAKSLKKTLDYIKSKDKNGSYDETFGATCAKLWIMSKCQGCPQQNINDTKTWIFNKMKSVSSFDYITGSIYLKKCNIDLTEHLKNELDIHIDNIISDSPNEISLLNILLVSKLYGKNDYFETIINFILDKSRDYIWIDYSTTATITLGLIEFYEDKYKNILSIETWTRLERHIFASTHLLRKNIYSTFGEETALDIVTMAKSIAVCSLFEDIIDFPTDEILTLIKSSNNSLRQNSINNNRSNLLEELRIENQEKTDILDKQTVLLGNNKKVETIYRYHVFISIVIYFMFILSLVYINNVSSYKLFIKKIFSDYLIFTLTFLPLVTTIYMIYKTIVKKRK